MPEVRIEYCSRKYNNVVDALAKYARINSILNRMFSSPLSYCMDAYTMDCKDIFNLVI